jgi:hypothetical protein
LKDRRSVDSKRRRRTKKGEIPFWFEEGKVLLRQSDGTMTDVAIAAEVGLKNSSSLSRSKMWKAERKKYQRLRETHNLRSDSGPSTENLGGAYTTPDDLYAQEKEDDSDDD